MSDSAVVAVEMASAGVLDGSAKVKRGLQAGLSTVGMARDEFDERVPRHKEDSMGDEDDRGEESEEEAALEKAPAVQPEDPYGVQLIVHQVSWRC